MGQSSDILRYHFSHANNKCYLFIFMAPPPFPSVCKKKAFDVFYFLKGSLSIQTYKLVCFC